MILSSRTTEVTSFYTLELESSSLLRRFGALDRERFPCLFRSIFHSPLKAFGGTSTETTTIGQVRRTRNRRC